MDGVDLAFAVEASSLAVNVDLLLDEVQQLVKAVSVEAFHELSLQLLDLAVLNDQ